MHNGPRTSLDDRLGPKEIVSNTCLEALLELFLLCIENGDRGLAASLSFLSLNRMLDGRFFSISRWIFSWSRSASFSVYFFAYGDTFLQVWLFLKVPDSLLGYRIRLGFWRIYFRVCNTSFLSNSSSAGFADAISPCPAVRRLRLEAAS